MRELEFIRARQDLEAYRKLHWEGSFADYLRLLKEDPRPLRTSFQRVHDMILAHGVEEYTLFREKLLHYRFFDDPFEGKDAVFGLDKPLMRLVATLKAAAHRLGPERRILLLHGPVGSAKSTIARLLKKGLEAYSRTEEGRLYTFYWKTEEGPLLCPMHEEPLHLLPPDLREEFLEELRALHPDYPYPLEVEGDLCPVCRFQLREALARHGGDLAAVLEEEVGVRRLVLSEKDRVGIGTFQPKDEKNQDSTELTGDINYRKVALYGSDSDPRAFNFDGELNVANRGLVEFIEILKLDVAFLYDLLTASQEHKIKSKKFAQTDIDEIILGHSVAGWTPILYRYRGKPGWTTLEGLYARFGERPDGLEVLAYDPGVREARWTRVLGLYRHPFQGELLTSAQKWGVVETTPNHSLYDREGRVFYPEEGREMLAIRRLPVPLAPLPRVVDVAEGVPGFATEEELALALGTRRLTRSVPPGYARLSLPRHATAVKARYHLPEEGEELKALLTVLVWYATEGHSNARNGGIVLSSANREELERVKAAYERVTDAKGYIHSGSKWDSAWRLYLGAEAIRVLAEHHCGKGAAHKRLPDFLFVLPRPYLEHAWEELLKTDGSRALSQEQRKGSEEYQRRYGEFKTISPLLAAQVGVLLSLLGYDYSVYLYPRPGRPPAYRVRYVSGEGKPGGRHKRYTHRLLRRPAQGEMVYDIACEGLHNFVCGVGSVVCHNTNEPEYRKLQANEYMEALRDRTIKIDVPYILRVSDEVRIYQRDFARAKKHIAPHTLEMAATWAVLTRLEPPKRAGLTLMQKLKLYDGKLLPGWTEEAVRELMAEAKREGLEGISPRYIQDKISNVLVTTEEPCINPFMVLNELEEGLKHHSLISDERTRERYRALLEEVKGEYAEIVKNEVQRAIAADEEALNRLFHNYIDHVKAYVLGEKVKNPYTGAPEPPNERLMRSVEERIDIPESRKDDFRREIMNYIGALALEGRTFTYRDNERLRRALEMKLFEDQKDTIRLSALVSGVVDPETQARIDLVKGRLIRDYGYCEHCAAGVLEFAASIFARGETR
ncbi:serine/threonine protein kinase [Thermus filiformis]|uniref:Serine/threonine protein kinase n=1 Tax=Thermus filiformis TaxID=276 RepID=A0A0A2WSH9_THEFI|nr:serine/threonine protein kinase [Thermus filiformis]KGQ23116.2 serine/threonine protein kinase [Thermus filiformis]